METSYADGTVGGPAFVFPSDGKMGLRRDYIRSSQRALVPSTTIYHASSDGRTNSAFTLAWLEAGLIPEIERRRAAIDEPDSLAIFMFDIESLEMTTEISTRLEAANILPFALPVQVADLVRFEPLTTAFEYTLACSGQAGKEVPLTDFLGWYAQIRHCSLTSQQVVARFTGRFVVPAQAARNNSAVCSFKGSLSASPSKSDSSSTEDEVQCSHEETLRTSTRRGGPANCKRWLPCNLH